MTDAPLLLTAWAVGVALVLGVPFSRRTIVAWWTYLGLRRQPEFRQRASVRRWLWLKTLAEANGRVSKRRDGR